MPKHLTLSTIKNRSSLHPSSRKAIQLDRVYLRQSKLHRRTSEHSAALQLRMERFEWFHSALSAVFPVRVLTLAGMKALVEMFLARGEAEESALRREREDRARKFKRSEGKSAREAELGWRMCREMAEYESGFEIPDFAHEPTLKLFLVWPSAAKISIKKQKQLKALGQQEKDDDDNEEQASTAVHSAYTDMTSSNIKDEKLDTNYLQLLRCVRVYKNSDVVTLSQMGSSPIYAGDKAYKLSEPFPLGQGGSLPPADAAAAMTE